MLTIIAALVLAAAGPAQDLNDCDRRSAVECRTVQPFALQVGSSRTDPIEVGKAPWIDANGRLLIFPGESVTVKYGDAGALEVAAVDAAQNIVSDQRVAQLMAQVAPRPNPQEETVALVPTKGLADPPTQGVRLTFRQADAGEDMLLFVENATDAPLAYNAAMLAPGVQGMEWQVTTICVVRSGAFSVEHWPYAIMSLSLGDFERGPEPPANGSLCG